MIEQFVGEQEARVLRVSPLGAHLDAFAAELIRAGYQRFTGQIRLRILKDLARLARLRRADLPVHDVLTNGDPPGHEIDIVPSQADQLAVSHAGSQSSQIIVRHSPGAAAS